MRAPGKAAPNAPAPGAAAPAPIGGDEPVGTDGLTGMALLCAPAGPSANSAAAALDCLHIPPPPPLVPPPLSPASDPCTLVLSFSPFKGDTLD